jgi:hypothetical protein
VKERERENGEGERRKKSNKQKCYQLENLLLYHRKALLLVCEIFMYTDEGRKTWGMRKRERKEVRERYKHKMFLIQFFKTHVSLLQLRVE